jgi:hypothetical protein
MNETTPAATAQVLGVADVTTTASPDEAVATGV